jgi:hypothetical protein
MDEKMEPPMWISGGDVFYFDTFVGDSCAGGFYISNGIL